MKRTYHADIPPINARLVPNRRALPLPRWSLAAASVVLVVASCLIGFSFLSASPSTSSSEPEPTAAIAGAVPRITGTVPFALPPVATATPVPTATPTPTLCDTGTAETRYVTDRNGAYVFDGVQDSSVALGLLSYRASVQTFGKLEGRSLSSSNKWYAVKYNNSCAYLWADPADSRLSTTRPK